MLRLLRNVLGGPGNDAIYNFTVTLPSSSFQFNTCDSQLEDTFLRIYNADGNQIRYGDDDGGCAWKTILQVHNLNPGEYTVLIEGYGKENGVYTLEMTGLNGGDCPGV